MFFSVGVSGLWIFKVLWNCLRCIFRTPQQKYEIDTSLFTMQSQPLGGPMPLAPCGIEWARSLSSQGVWRGCVSSSDGYWRWWSQTPFVNYEFGAGRNQYAQPYFTVHFSYCDCNYSSTWSYKYMAELPKTKKSCLIDCATSLNVASWSATAVRAEKHKNSKTCMREITVKHRETPWKTRERPFVTVKGHL